MAITKPAPTASAATAERANQLAWRSVSASAIAETTADTNAGTQPALPAVPETVDSHPADNAAAPADNAGTPADDPAVPGDPVSTSESSAPAVPSAGGVANCPAPISVHSETPPPRCEDFPPLPSPGVDRTPAPPLLHLPPSRMLPSVVFSTKAVPPTTRREADLQRGLALSMGLQMDVTNGASSSHRQADLTPSSPPKHQRADTAGHAVPTGSTPAPEHAPAPAPRACAPRSAPRTDYHTVDGNPPQGSFTNPPPHGFRRVYGLTTGIVFCNHPTGQRRQWDGIAHPKIISTIGGGNGDHMLTAGLLRNHIASRFNMNPSDLLIGPPGQAEGPGPDPMAWLVAGLTEEQATALLDIQALVSNTLTVFFFPYSLPISGFVGTFYGFTIPSDNDDLALTVIGDAAMADPAITYMTADEVLARVGESMWVAPIPLLSLRSVPFTAWNVYFGSSPTESESLFEALRALFAKLIIDTPFHGQGRIFYCPLRCSLCPAPIILPTSAPSLSTPAGWAPPPPQSVHYSKLVAMQSTPWEEVRQAR
ncbi:hypothetical protein B0H13DRAFT_1919516 [Mycena leptocephala]|nr:hypothetical protein B0H13DRAFT_1919516 [Mycena leptocephala]